MIVMGQYDELLKQVANILFNIIDHDCGCGDYKMQTTLVLSLLLVCFSRSIVLGLVHLVTNGILGGGHSGTD
jgi:hypothetical protein